MERVVTSTPLSADAPSQGDQESTEGGKSLIETGARSSGEGRAPGAHAGLKWKGARSSLEHVHMI